MNTIITKTPYNQFMDLYKDDKDLCSAVMAAKYHHLGDAEIVIACLEKDRTTIKFFDMHSRYLSSTDASEESYNSMLEELSEHVSEIGKYVICKDVDGGGRLRVYRNSLVDYVRKNGWLDTFTLTKDATEVGKTYLCQIKKFTEDKDGYTNLHVKVVADIDEDISQYLLCCNNYMSSIYCYVAYNTLNFAAAIEKVPEDVFFAAPADKSLHETIRTALHSKTDVELQLDELLEYAKANPSSLVAKYLQKKSITEYVDRVFSRYWILRDRGEIKETDNLLQRAILTEEYYGNSKKSKKSKKKNKADE